MPLTIKEIIAEADERLQNEIGLGSKLRKINIREGELFRTIYKKKTATVMDINAGQFLYPLSFTTSKIIHVIVDGKRYDYEEIDKDESEPPYLYTYQTAIGIYPTPEKDVGNGIFIHHYLQPTIYSEENQDVYPDLDGDFHQIHVFGLIIDMATVLERFDLANGYITQYNTLIDELKKSLPEPELPPMKVE